MAAPHLELAAIEDAVVRLAGLVVRTPLIGEPALPGVERSLRGIRLKAENLQVGGGIWYRGTALWLLRQLGRHGRGFVVGAGSAVAVRPALCAVAAARMSRAPFRLFRCTSAWSDRQRALLDELLRETDDTWDVLDCDDEATVATAVEDAVRGGLTRFPTLPVDDPLIATGIATAGMELAPVLPSDCLHLLCGRDELVEPVRAGLHAGGRTDVLVEVIGGVSDSSTLRARSALADGAGLSVDDDSAAVLTAVPTTADTVCVLLHA